MRALVRYGSVGVLVLAALAAIALVAPFPVIYTPENVTYPREGHVNIEVLKAKALSSEGTIYPVMQDLLDYSGPIMISIRSDNFEEARADILEYVRRQGDLRHLIVNLDLNETEIRDFLDSQERQAEILGDLVNATSAFNDLSILEVKYREEGESGALVSISYQGESLRNRISALRERYLEESRTVTPLVAHHGLENTTYEESFAELAGIVERVDRDQEERNRAIDNASPSMDQPTLSLVIRPESGRYLDEVQVFGSRSGEDRAGKPVTLTLDGSPFAGLETDARGAFSTPFTIELVPAGNHTMGAESLNLEAVPRTLVVERVDSAINLTVRADKNSPGVSCSGYLMANRPVRHAPVEILWEGHEPFAAATDGSGLFRATLRLPAGTHRLTARFANRSYPVNGSMSATYEVTSTGETIPSIRREGEDRWSNGTAVSPGEAGGGAAGSAAGTVARVLPVAFVVLLAAVAALGYLRRGERRRAAPPASPPGAEKPAGMPLDLFREVPSPPPEETLGALYLRSLRELGLPGAAHLVFRRFASIIGVHTGIGDTSPLTAREIARACTARPYGRVFFAFVHCYERIRYAGQKGEGTRRGFEDSMEQARSALEGDGR